jgi:DNA-binding CsgD family transcriptional regulator
LKAQGVKGIPRGPRPNTRANRFGLTEREMEALALIEQGLSNSDIAARMGISPKTVDNHIQHIYNKLGVSTRTGAVLFAMEQNLVEARRVTSNE